MADVNYSKSILVFFLTVIAASLLLVALTTVFQFKATGVTIVIPLISALFAGQSFVKKYQRAPAPDEVKRLSNLSFFYYVGFQILLLIVALANPKIQQLFAEMNGAVAAIALIFLLFYFGIAYVFMRWAYGGLTRKFAEKNLK